METQHDLTRRIARATQQACIEAARRGFADAAQSGLCGDGALEAALGAIETLDLDAVLRRTALPER